MNGHAKTRTIAVAGAGFAGAVIARELAEKGDLKVEVFDTRSHIAGNCHTERDDAGIMIHVYGPHIFHTSNEEVWAYVNRFAKFGPYVNRVKAHTKKGMFSLPINLLTINQFFQKKFSPEEAQKFLASKAKKFAHAPKNFEEQALAFLGKEIYENFFRGYTIKQWGIDPKALPASILQRLPVRFDYNDNYFNDKYQGIPLEGYTKMVERILNHKNITVHVGTKITRADKDQFAHMFYTGPLDEFFGWQFGELRYRSLEFKKFTGNGDFQGNPVINYCEAKIPYTRIAEHKHFAPWEKHTATTYFQEFPKDWQRGDVPYYPMRLEKDKEKLEQYQQLAVHEDKVTFAGRLGTYRYLDMHVVIEEALTVAEKFLTGRDKNQSLPVAG